MPETKIIFYQDIDGTVPILEWLRQLQKSDEKAFSNCLAKIKQLQEYGYELRRPASDYLRDGIRELRTKHRKVQYRILYFFHNQNVAILAHSIIKKGEAVPDFDIDKAIERKDKFEKQPLAYTYTAGIDDETDR